MVFNRTLFSCNISNNSNISETIDITNDCSSYIGFSSKKGAIAILILSILGFIFNFSFLIFQHIRIRRKKKNSSRNLSMRKLFQILPLFDSITAIYWVISSFYFQTAKDLEDNYEFCTILSIFYLVYYTFQFVMINCVLIHFRRINLNPMTGILKPYTNLFKYLIISLIIGLAVGSFGVFFDVIGRSPMNTCFINTDKNERNGLFFLIPIFFILVAIIQIIIDLCCRKMFITDKGVREIHKKNSLYVFIFCVLHIPMIVLFVHTSIELYGSVDIPDDIFRYYSFFVTLFSSMIPLITSLIRYFQGLTKIECVNDLFKNNRVTKMRKTSNLRNSNSIRIKKDSQGNNTRNPSLENDPFEWVESHVMECFMRDIFIGIVTGLKKSKQYGDDIKMLEEAENSMDYEKYNINFKTFEELELNDDSVTESDYLSIKVINYAPKSFAYLRQIEKINIDEMIESFLPKNNRQGLKKSQGKSGSFFISTDDNKYMIKSLKSDEIDLIRNGFLKKYIEHIDETKNKSLLCRLYGMFSIIFDQGDEILIIVMRNVIGTLKDNTVVKFDLKGSTYKRKADFDVDNLNRDVMKDLNFNEIEQNIKISQDSIDQLRSMISSDSKFLSESELMDYSLFLVKITLNKEEAEEIFGQNIKQNQEKAIKKLFSSQLPNENDCIKNNNIIDNNDNNNDNDNENSILKIDELKNSYKINGNFNDIKYYKQYLFPGLTQGTGYIISIIDYFQYFNFFKVVEAGIISKFKTGLSKKKNNTMSCVDPKTYSERFITYFNQLTDISQIIKGSEAKYDDEDEENKNEIKNEIKNEEIKTDNDNIDEKQQELLDIYDNNDNANEEENSIKINIKDPKVHFNLRITIMNKNVLHNSRKTHINFKRNNTKFNE
jgi:hypothetical protein